MALVNEHFLKLSNNYLFADIAKKVNAFKATKQQAIEYLKGYAERQARQQREEAAKAMLNEQLNQAETIDLFAEENKLQNQPQAQPQSQPQVQQSTPITVQESKPVQETKEVPQESVKKPILDLQESEKSLNFAQIYNDRNMQNQFLDLIEEKFGDELPEADLKELGILREKETESVVRSVDAEKITDELLAMKSPETFGGVQQENLKLYKSLYTALRGKGLSLISIGY